MGRWYIRYIPYMKWNVKFHGSKPPTRYSFLTLASELSGYTNIYIYNIHITVVFLGLYLNLGGLESHHSAVTVGLTHLVWVAL